MSGQILETERSALEEIERIEKAITDRIIYNPGILPDSLPLSKSSSLNGKKKRPIRDTVLHELEIARFLDRYQEQCEYVHSVLSGTGASSNKKRRRAVTLAGEESVTTNLADLHRKEIAVLGTYPAASQEMFNQYYEQVDAIKSFYRRYPNEGVEDLEKTYAMTKTIHEGSRSSGSRSTGNINEGGLTVDDTNVIPASMKYNGIISSFALDIDLDVLFSGEEYYGRFLDLVSLHERFLNLRFVQRQLSYVQYLGKVADFNDSFLYTSARLRDQDYFQYIFDLHAYLESFLRKTRILSQPEVSLRNIEENFESAWDSKTLPSWLAEAVETKISHPAEGDEQENALGDNAGSLFCGPCGKSFANDAVYKNHLTGRKHKKNAEAQNESKSDDSGLSTATSDLKFRVIASHEYIVHSISELLAKTISNTISNVERRQALTDRERKLEIEAFEREAMGVNRAASDGEDNDGNNNNSDDDDEDDVIYNPLKLPLGWDGKPIPFWLWKLQGLGIEYECEVCGNYRYMGRKVFDKHFMEPRHTHGLRCLGIKPNMLFKGITKISEAIACK